MFKNEIVFIIGAGANAEFGFPLGSKLKSDVARALQFQHASGNRGSEEVARAIRNMFGVEAKRVMERAVKLSKVIPQFISIDEALHYMSADSDAVWAGKAAIVNAIAEAEHNSTLAEISKRHSLEPFAKSWLPVFLQMVLSGCQKREVVNAFTNVTVINFNYDRSLEQYLFWALQDTADLDQAEACAAIDRLKIIRPYGSLGGLIWQGRGGYAFGEKAPDLLAARSKLIRAYTETDGLDDIRNEIQERLSRAKVVVFLGFGFHDQNMMLLRTGGSPLTQLRAVYATTYEIDRANQPSITRTIDNCFTFMGRPQNLLSYRAGDMLHELRLSIMESAR